MLLTPDELQRFLDSRKDDPEVQATVRRVRAAGLSLTDSGPLAVFTVLKMQADAAEALIQSLPNP
jgi:hypothetical protein